MELKRLLKLAFPLMVYYITEVAMGITDMIIVGRLGSAELAAVGLSANIVIELVVVCFSILSMVGVLSSQALGEERKDRVALIVGQGLLIAMVLSVLALLLTSRIPWLYAVTGQDEEVIRLSKDYLAWFVWIIPFALVFVVLRNFLTVLSKPGFIIVVTLPAVGLNLLLNYILVYGHFGFPAMGVAGAGAASVAVNLVMVSALLTYARLQRDCRSYPVINAMRRLNTDIWRSVIFLGTPAGMVAVLEGGLFVVVGIMMGSLGADLLAANEIMFHIIPLAFVVALAIGEAAAVRIAFHAGAGHPSMIRWIAGVAITMGCGVMLCSATIMWFFPQQVISLFIDTSNPENARVVEIALSLIAIAAVFQLFDGLQVVTAWCLRGMRDTFVPMWIASAGYWICGLGSGYLFGFKLGFGAEGVWYGLAAGLFATSLLLAGRLRAMLRKITPLTPVRGQ